MTARNSTGVENLNLGEYLRDKLQALGAITGVRRELAINTQAGMLEVSIYDDKVDPWVACIFDDVEKAKQIVRHGRLNKYCGKWNWHSSKNENRKEFAERVLGHIAAIV